MGRSHKSPSYEAKRLLGRMVAMSFLSVWHGRDAPDGGDLGCGVTAVYDVVVEGMSLALARPKQRLVSVGPSKLGQRLVWRSVLCFPGIKWRAWLSKPRSSGSVPRFLPDVGLRRAAASCPRRPSLPSARLPFRPGSGRSACGLAVPPVRSGACPSVVPRGFRS